MKNIISMLIGLVYGARTLAQTLIDTLPVHFPKNEHGTNKEFTNTRTFSDMQTNKLLFSGTTIVLMMAGASSAFCQFSASQLISDQTPQATSVYAADLDGDLDLDVLSTSAMDHKVAWYENDGTGIFGPQNVITTDAYRATDVLTADIDSDGDNDVVWAALGDNNQNFDRIAWQGNDGSGNFDTIRVITTNVDSPHEIFAADLDSDGDIDILSATSNDNKIAWYENDGSGNFGPQLIIDNLTDALSVGAADLNDDGLLDVFGSGGDPFYNNGRIVWYENFGSGTFGPRQTVNSSTDQSRKIRSADIDLDGDLELISLSHEDENIVWHQNLSNDSISSIANHLTPLGSIETFAIGNIDGNCAPDIVCVGVNNSPNNQFLTWFADSTNGHFHQAPLLIDGFPGIYVALDVDLVDLDADGMNDVLVANHHSNKITWYKNMFSCDSATITIDTVASCPVMINGSLYDQSGQYVQVIDVEDCSCDTTLNINLQIELLNDTIIVDQGMLIAQQDSAHYQWINCATDSSINGATNQSYTPVLNGNYAVVVEYQGCTDTSSCVNVFWTGVSETVTSGSIISPNPTTGNFTITASDPVATSELTILDMTGKLVHRSSLSGRPTTMDLDLTPGPYLVTLAKNEKRYRTRLIVTR